MKNKVTKFLLPVALTLLMLVCLSLTAFAHEGDHEWADAADWSSNATQHWHACTVDDCAEKNDLASHRFTAGVCTVCGYQCTHEDAEYQSTAERHWQHCDNCGQDLDNVEHSYDTFVSLNTEQHTYKCVCGKTKSEGHDFDYTSDGVPGHHAVCSICDYAGDRVSHNFGNGTVVPASCFAAGYTEYVCSDCDFTSKETNPDAPATGNHTAASTWSSDATNHWKACTTSGCTEKLNTGAHSWGTGVVSGSVRTYTCSVCSKTKIENVSATAISYTISSDNTLKLSSTKFSSAFKSIYSGGTATGVKFTYSSTPGSSTGYMRYSSSNITTSDKLDDYGYYLSSTNKPTNYSRNITSLSFKPGSKTSDYTFVLNAAILGKDSGGTERTVNTTVTFKVSYAGSSDTEIELSVDYNDVLYLDADDFKDVFATEYGTTPRYVKFVSGGNIGSNYGFMYDDYTDEDDYNKKFTNTTIDDYEFYLSSSTYGDYDIEDLAFVPEKDDVTAKISFKVYDSSNNYVNGTLIINIGDADDDDDDDADETITYSTDHDTSIYLDASDFKDIKSTAKYVVFTYPTAPTAAKGYLYRGSTKITSSGTLDNNEYYISDDDYGDYDIEDLKFTPGSSTSDYTFTVNAKLYYGSTGSSSMTIAVKFKVTGDDDDVDDTEITYSAETGSSVTFKSADFINAFKEEYSTTTPSYVKFGTTSYLSASYGFVYYNYGLTGQKQFTGSTIDDYKFGLSSSASADYLLANLKFVPGTKTGTYNVTIPYTIYYSTTKKVEGTLTIKVTEGTTVDNASYDIVFNTTKNTQVSLNANEFKKFFQLKYPTYTLGSIKFTGVPATGAIYYNYAGTSKYGSATQIKLSTSNYNNYTFSYAPTNTANYDIDALTYVPSGTNYCVEIPFKATSTDGAKSVSGKVLVNVTSNNLSEVYFSTTKGTSVKFNAADFNAKINAAVGVNASYIVFGSLTPTTYGTLYYGYTSTSSYDHKVALTNKYMLSGTTGYSMDKVTFVPYSTFTGNAVIPFVAYNTAGTAIAAGQVSVGVVATLKTFGDVAKTQWFYKYVTELSDTAIVNGYPDGTFKPDNKTTYGEALKLIMLAADYSEQAAANNHWAGGYMNKAIADGLISGKVNLDAQITRADVAKIAAKAMKLPSPTSSDSPFSDTTDASVISLYNAGIVVGSFDDTGARKFNPTNTITRAEITTIIWRMYQAQ